MKHIFIAIALITSLGLSAQNDNTLRVQGQAEIEVIPDLMKFNLNFNINADTQDESVQELNELMDRVITELKKVGIQEDSIKTDNFRTNVVDNTYRNGKNFFTSSQQMHFTINADSKQIVTVLNVLSDVKGDFNFSTAPLISNLLMDKKEKEMTSLAFANAKEQAQLLSSVGDFELGLINNVDFRLNRPVTQRKESLALEEVVVTYADQNKNFGNYNLAPQTLRKSVWVTYYIKQ